MSPLLCSIINRDPYLADLVLRPRWHAIHEHVSQAPDPIGQVRRHRRRPGLPLFDGAGSIDGLRQGQT